MAKKIYYGNGRDNIHTVHYCSGLITRSSQNMPEEAKDIVSCAVKLSNEWFGEAIDEEMKEVDMEHRGTECSSLLEENDSLEKKVEEAKNEQSSNEGYDIPKQLPRRNIMQKLEMEMVQSCDLWLYNDEIVRFNGQTYDFVDEKTFVTLARMYRPDTVEEIRSYPQFKSVIQFMHTNPDIVLEETTGKETLIPFSNCVFDVEDGSLHPFTRDVPLFYKLKCRYTEDETMPAFTKFLKTTFQDNDKAVELLYEIIGYLVCNGRLAKKFIVWADQPDSGKSILASWIASLFEEESTSSISLTKLADQFSLGNLDRIRFNYCMELPRCKISDDTVAIIKQLTGDPVITTERKFQDQKKVKHQAKFLFGTNNNIELLHDDEAFWNRMVLLPFCRSIPPEERDPDLLNKLRSESSQIVSKAARACVELHRRNYEFTKTEQGDNMIMEWRGENIDIKIKNFVDKYCTITRDEEDFIPTQKAYDAYCSFCSKQGQSPGCLVKQFSNTMRRLFNIEKAKRAYRGYDNPLNGFGGIRFKEE